ncbi:MAG: hypothetical protein KDA85_17105, partial [Planctomycetaceae bacterium]|nr:hypothetical protein [Planctomycetaceae bacterium]
MIAIARQIACSAISFWTNVIPFRSFIGKRWQTANRTIHSEALSELALSKWPAMVGSADFAGRGAKKNPVADTTTGFSLGARPTGLEPA